MRKHALLAALALGAMGGVSGMVIAAPPAAPANPAFAAAESALHEYYGPDAQLRHMQEWEQNGQKVEYYAVTAKDFQGTATVTQHGELLMTGVNVHQQQLQQPVLQVLQLFKVQPNTVAQQEFHNYYVTVNGPGNQPYSIEIDAVGRVVSVHLPNQMAEELSGRPAPANIRDQISGLAQQRFPGAVIEGIFEAPHDPGYYRVNFHDAKGPGWAIMSQANDIRDRRLPFSREGLPAPVTTTLTGAFAADNIQYVQRGNERVYQAIENVQGEQLTLHIRPNGQVDSVSSATSKTAEDASTAAHHLLGK